MQTIRRYGSSALVATAVTFALFFLMQALIATGQKDLEEKNIGRLVDIVRVEREETLQRRERVERPPEQVKPPEIDVPQNSASSSTQTLFNFDFNLRGDNLSGIGVGTGDGEYVPIVQVAPIYPQRARAQGIEGWVLLEFTVDRDGTVIEESIQVLAAEPKGWFERAAKQSVAKSRYKPRVINGEPVEVPGVTRRIDFKLAEE